MTTVDILRKHLKEERSFDLGDDDSLLENGVLDSMGIVKLVEFIEDEFGVELSDDEFDPDNFETLNQIAALITSKQSS